MWGFPTQHKTYNVCPRFLKHSIHGEGTFPFRAKDPEHKLSGRPRSGEFIFNASSGVLAAIFPPECLRRGKVVCKTRVVPSSAAGLVQVTALDNMIFSGMNFTGSVSGFSLKAVGCNNLRVERCHFHNVAKGLAVIPVRSGSHAKKRASRKAIFNLSLIDSRFSFIALTGAALNGGNRTDLTPSGFKVQGCVFHDFGRCAQQSMRVSAWPRATFTDCPAPRGAGGHTRTNLASTYTALLWAPLLGQSHLSTPEFLPMRSFRTAA